MISNNLSTHAPQNWSNYQFEIEKYMDQMSNNPYFNELEDELQQKKINKIKTYFKDKDIIEKLGDEDIDYIIEKCENESGFRNFNKIYQEQVSEDISDKEKLEKIYNILEQDLIISKNIELNPSKLRISTMTACCMVGTSIDTVYLYKTFKGPGTEIVSDEAPKGKKKRVYKKNIVKRIIGCKAEDFPVKGYFEKEKKSNFFNSASLNVLISDNKCINVKVFKNGNVQMTGVPDEERGQLAVEVIIAYLKSVPDDPKTGTRIVANKKLLKSIDFRTVMINSDYFCGFEIQRENLLKILSQKYDLSAAFDSENYPGVKLEYFWNTNTLGGANEGKCACKKQCKGKGNGEGDGCCKKVTVSTFQSGKVIVTGARTKQQLNSAYNFINKIFSENYHYIRKKKKSKKLENKKFFFIKKTNISNYSLYQQLL